MRPSRGLLVLIVAAILPLVAEAFESTQMDAGVGDRLDGLRRQSVATAMEPGAALVHGKPFNEVIAANDAGVELKADGEQMPGPETSGAETGNRPSAIGFKGNTYVLPRTGSPGIPVSTINVKRVRLRILKVDARTIAGQLSRGRLESLLAKGGSEHIRSDGGKRIWQDEKDVAYTLNQRVTTVFAVGDALKKIEPGVYAAVVEPADSGPAAGGARAAQWLVISDLGMTAIRGADGLHVFVRSLSTAKPVAGVTTRLFARNNVRLGEAVTDGDGGAHFATGLLRGDGGRAPRALFAEGAGGDFNFLDLRTPALDLGDRGVGGREPPGPVDVFLYGDRGIYRPGDTAHVVALMRDDAARAVDTTPLTLKVLRPDGVEARRETIKAGKVGAFVFDLPLPHGALAGRWTVEAHLDPEAAPVGTLHLVVEDAVPSRIGVKLSTAATLLKPGQGADLAVKADYLYGAPAAGLAAEGEMVVLADDNPYPDWPGYRFGLADETVQPQRIAVAAARTDGTGGTTLGAVLDKAPETTLPLKAVIRAGVFELGGGPATASLTLPVRQRTNAVGLHPRFAANGVAAGSDAVFDIIVLNAAGKRVAGKLTYAIYREDRTYQWVQRNGAWDYAVQGVDHVLAGGSLDVTVEAPLALTQRVGAGRYRVEVMDTQTGAAASLRFHAGWFVSPTAADYPDALELTADNATYRPGDVVRLHIKPPFDAEVLLTVANERVIATKSMSVPAVGATADIPFTDAWGAGAYVLATAFRPDSAERGSGRAIGLVWLGMDAGPRTLNLTIEAPPEARPRGSAEIKVAVDNLEPGKPAFLTLAAVDENVLRLTGFDTPDPAGYFYGRRRLGVAVRDLYGPLIDDKAAQSGTASGSGNSPLAGRGAPPAEGRTAALFSGLVVVDGEGRAHIRLDLPDFIGRLRLMAVAFDGTRVGAAEGALVVRDPLAVQAALPRFLRPGDESRLTVRLDNQALPQGEFAVSFRAEGAVTLSGETKLQKTLAKGESAVVVVGLTGLEAGTGTITMELAGPDGFKQQRQWHLTVSPAPFPVTRREVRRLQPGETMTYAPSTVDAFVPGTAELLLSFGPRPDVDVSGLLRALERYPYGCLEQTVSRALPLLYVPEGAEFRGGDGTATSRRARIDEAIARLFEMQRPDGGFAPWAPTGDADLWLTAYALDFVTRAKAKGYRVPAATYVTGLGWLGQRVKQGERAETADLAGFAYAHYVLAAARGSNAAETQSFADRVLDRLPTPMAVAQVAAALAIYGDGERARVAFGKAIRKTAAARPALRDYGSPLRDLAGLVTLAAESGRLLKGVDRDWGGRTLGKLVEDLVARQTKAEAMSPQEEAWLLMAAIAAGHGGGKMTLIVDGWTMDPRDEPLYLRPTAAQLAVGLTYANAGKSPIWHTATITGIPLAEAPAMAEGFSLNRVLYTLDGKPADLAAVRRNDLLVAVIGGEAPGDVNHQALIVDRLPAGFEIESARLDDARTTRELGWLPRLSPLVHAEFRDDRFVAALDIKGGNRAFAVAYLVRAVTPGRYRLPAVQIEDMYKPQYRGRTVMGWLTVAPGR